MYCNVIGVVEEASEYHHLVVRFLYLGVYFVVVKWFNAFELLLL